VARRPSGLARCEREVRAPRCGELLGRLGHQTYGYDVVRVGDHSERRVNKAEANVVKLIFEMAAEGSGERRIVNALNDRGEPAPGAERRYKKTTISAKGKPLKHRGWSKEQVRRVLSNSAYVGDVVYGKSKSKDGGGSAGRRAAVPQDDWSHVKAPALRVVGDDLWEAAQERRRKTKEHWKFRGEKGQLLGKPESGLQARYLLNGIARCGSCGGALRAGSGRGKR